MKRTTLWFWSVVAAQALFLLSWAGWHEHVRSHGAVIVLKTRPVDPRDLLRGDYMILGYEIGVVPTAVAGEGGGGEAPALGEECWAVLEPRDGYHALVRMSAAEPDVEGGQIAVLARRGPRGLEYGIETYYVPEGKGTPTFKKIEVEAAVSGTHRLAIKRVLLDGKKYP